MPLKTRRVEEMIHVRSVEVQSPPVGVMWKFGEGLAAQVSFSSLSHGSKLRDSSPIALVFLYSVTLINPHSFTKSAVEFSDNSEHTSELLVPPIPFLLYPPCRMVMHVKSVKAQTSSRWCRVEVRTGEALL
ncbi:hypothetical protein TNCV_1164171 [Trichonephila clavipes]|nr:hypothetical protein TNCV_1164171 [Trichonephila clavipes]